MKIAILGWGSLIWQPKDLRFDKEFGWNDKGPFLPIEFSRISSDGRLTLVIDSKAKEVQTLYTVSLYRELDEVILDLAVREGTGKKSIGYYIKTSDEFFPEDFDFKENIKEWINYSDCDAVIWTNLPEKWEVQDEDGEVLVLKVENRISYLENLTGNKKVLAEKYIRKAPKQIETKARKEIEEELGWTLIETKRNE